MDNNFLYDPTSVMIMMGTFFLILLIACIISLVLHGIPLYKMAKNANINNAWLSFIPIGNMYILINIPSNEFNFFNLYRTKDRKSAFIFYILSILISSFLCGLLGMIPCIGVLFTLFISIFLIMLNYCIYRDLFSTYYNDATTITLMTVFSILIPIVGLVLLYVTMGKNRIDSDNYYL